MGRLILAIQKERDESVGELDAQRAQQVLDRAHVLLQAAQNSVVSNFLDGRSIEEYLDPVWIEGHPAVKPRITALVSELRAHENE